MKQSVPCIKCDDTLFDYINPYLEDFGYNIRDIYPFKVYPLLVLNIDGVIGDCTNINLKFVNDYNRELVADVEEFLERAANLMGKSYKKKNAMKINGIEIKPGMGIHILDETSDNFFIVFPAKKDLGVIAYGKAHYWDYLNDFLETHSNDIVAIRSAIDGELIWEKPKEFVVTMQEIADKFGVDINLLKIKK